MTELPNTVAEAQATLYAAMRRGTDPRWGAEPVEPIKPPRRLWLLAIPAAGLGLIVLATMGVLQ